MDMCKVMLLFWIFGIVIFADEMADFAAFADPYAVHLETDAKESFKKREKELNSEAVKRFIERTISGLEKYVNSSLQQKLEWLSSERRIDMLSPQELFYTKYDEIAIREYQTKHSIPDKKIRDALHAIIINCRGSKKEQACCGSDKMRFAYYAKILMHYGNETTLPILEKIMAYSQELTDDACKTCIYLTNGEVKGKLWQYFCEDDNRAFYARNTMIDQVTECCWDYSRGTEGRKRYCKALLQLFYLGGCDVDVGKRLVALRYYDLRFLRLYKKKLIVLATINKDRESISELKFPRWQKIKVKPKEMEDCFQEIVKRRIPEESRILRPEQIMGNDGK